MVPLTKSYILSIVNNTCLQLQRFRRNFECKARLRPSSTCAKLPYRILAFIVVFEIISDVKNEVKVTRYNTEMRFSVQGGPKNRTCLSVDNSAMVSGRKTRDTSKVSECCKE